MGSIPAECTEFHSTGVSTWVFETRNPSSSLGGTIGFVAQVVRALDC